ncbi:cytidine/deoxycytidylate deaminase family protein [Candidatus Parcubacteria bacterium]|nr:cytidine/deoxycytidylate deaminase family protein [Patescibacteria group bacterium]MCG2694350.1 cytidine/deoxycytidylate deaminase family protein [Candidatus Parcubacteria bacterium]
MQNFIRPSWDDYFMAIARIVATRSTCDRLRAGAVLVKNKRIISTGYNGSPPGLPHCDSEAGHLMEEGHCVRTIHAEHNAILQAATVAGQTTEGATLYALYSPCIHCCKYIVAAGIKRIVIETIYRNSQAIDYLKTAGLEVVFYEPNQEWNNNIKRLFEKNIEKIDEKAVILEENVPIEQKKEPPNNFGQIY